MNVTYLLSLCMMGKHDAAQPLPDAFDDSGGTLSSC